MMPFEPTTESSVRSELRQMVMEVFTIEREPTGDPDLLMQRDGILLFNPNGALTATFEGRLLIDSETAYSQLDAAFAKIDHVPYFREHEDRHVIHAVRGRIRPKPRGWYWNAILFVATFLSVLLLGFIYTFKVFDIVYVMTRGGPVNATTVLPIYVYLLSFNFFRFGDGAAAAVLLLLPLSVVAVGYLWLSQREEAAS